MIRPSTRLRLTAAAASLLLCSACRVDIRVMLDAEGDGSGEVRAEVHLDRDALASVPDLAEQLRVDDLRQAGWRVEGPIEQRGGGAVVRAVRPYDNPAEAERAFDELSGDGGPFQDFRVDVDRSFATTRTSFRGTVDLTSGVEGFSDSKLAERLGGQPLGVDPAALEEQAGQVFSDIFKVRVAAQLPGDVESNAPIDAANGAVWQPKLGDKVTLEATATRVERGNLALAATAVASGVLFLLMCALHVRRLVRRRARVSGPVGMRSGT